MSRGGEATAPPPSPPGEHAAGTGPGVAALGHLAAALAHEVRNPLNAMSIHLELLESRLAGSGGNEAIREGAARSLHALREGIARIDESLVNYVGAVGAIEAERQPVPVHAVLVAAARRAATVAAERRVQIVVERERDPATGKEATRDPRWSVDVPALAIALDTLIDNALQASAPGAPVRLVSRTGDERGEIRIIDEGEGMTPEVLAEAMSIGFSTRGHAGLGLAVARQAIRGQGGALTLRSDGPGRGTTAIIELPFV